MAKFLIILFCLYAFLQLLWTLAFVGMERRMKRLAKKQAVQETKEAAYLDLGHELRTPLTSILLAVNEINEIVHHDVQRNDSKQQHDTLLRVISVSAKTLLALINDQLDMGAITAGKLVLHPLWVETAILIDEIVLVLAPLCAQNGSRINVHVDLEKPFQLLDRNRVRQVIMNLCTNSIKYSNGSIWLSVRGHGGRLVVSVKDGGRGMEEADLKQLFTHFSRLETGVGGTGLGLCISQSLIKLMNGTIQVKSEPGVGSVFSFDIPCEFGGEEARQKRSSNTSSLISSSDDLFLKISGECKMIKNSGELEDADFLSFDCPVPSHVLVVDDTEVNLKLIIRSLDRLGIRTTGASSGLQALELAKKTRFDLVLLDFFMPGLSGAETCDLLRKVVGYENAPIICVTASERPANTSFTDYLGKPFLTKDLQDLISTYLTL